MNKILALIIIINSLVISGIAQEATIHGTVTGNGAAISGARVSVKNHPNLIAFSNSSGEFSISGSVPVVNYKSTQSVAGIPFVKNNQFQFTTTQNISDVSIDFFTPQGRLLASKKLTSIISGNHSFPLLKTSQSMYLTRLNIGENTYVLRVLNGVGSVFSNRSVPNAKSAVLAKTTASSSIIDTLVVTAENWKNALIELPDYKQNVNITLSVSTPWKPSGILTHDKGMVKIMAKDFNFEMGQSEQISSSEEIIYSEQPVHTVSFTYNFWMDTTEITQKEYDAIMKKWYPKYVPSTSRDINYGVGDNLPVYFLNWDDAALFCNAKSKEYNLDTVYKYSEIEGSAGELSSLINVSFNLTKNGYHLPTEAEWEYACRGGTATDYYWGKNYGTYPVTAADTAEINKYAFWRVNSLDLGLGNNGYGVHTVGSTLPNAYGLYDMAGNVSEHINDFECFSYDYGSTSDPKGPESGVIHLIRGGNWNNGAANLRSACRNLSYETYPFFVCGFRTVKTEH